MNQQVFERLGEELKNGEKPLKVCPRCGGTLKLRNGKFGSFFGCSSYPDCRYTENVANETKELMYIVLSVELKYQVPHLSFLFLI